jgi:hypothetical protein
MEKLTPHESRRLRWWGGVAAWAITRRQLWLLERLGFERGRLEVDEEPEFYCWAKTFPDGDAVIVELVDRSLRRWRLKMRYLSAVLPLLEEDAPAPAAAPPARRREPGLGPVD